MFNILGSEKTKHIEVSKASDIQHTYNKKNRSNTKISTTIDN
jgi:phosphoribosylaminoimidazole carboxylase (NCAIR synthetase)